MGTAKTEYALRFYLEGISEPFLFRIAKADWERLERVLREARDDLRGSFFCFDMKGYHTVAVSLAHLQWVDWIEQPSAQRLPPIEPFSDISTDGYEVRFYFRGRPEPFDVELCEPSYAAELMFYLDSWEHLSEAALQSFDLSGQRVAFRPDQLVIYIAPEWLVSEGHEEMRIEEEEAEAALAAKAKATRRRRVGGRTSTAPN